MASKIAASKGRIPLRVGRAILDSAISEKEFQARIITVARLYGWLVYHVPDSRMVTCRGFLDLSLVHPIWHRFLMVEVKTEKGKLRPEQMQWLDALRASGIEVHVWRPSMWTKIQATLQGKG